MGSNDPHRSDEHRADENHGEKLVFAGFGPSQPHGHTRHRVFAPSAPQRTLKRTWAMSPWPSLGLPCHAK
jgi:hypothetical protein